MSLPSSCRLKKKSDFLKVQELAKSSGQKLYGRSFLLLVAPSDKAYSRLGVTVTLKIDKRAVVRNRIKRRVREAFRSIQPILRAPIDIVIIARQGSGECELGQIQREFKESLKRGGYIE
ncbi:MAG: ribonuclease P protein component [Oligoflexia bacterium]|nr:ribonuclease P protein component [Oligoflexia bacterium]